MIKKLFRQMTVTQIISSMTVTICMLIDSIMIARFLGVESMSAYGFANPLLLVFAALGSMISAGRQYILRQAYLVTFPGICIALIVLSFNLVGDALRDALDPRLKH